MSLLNWPVLQVSSVLSIMCGFVSFQGDARQVLEEKHSYKSQIITSGPRNYRWAGGHQVPGRTTCVCSGFMSWRHDASLAQCRGRMLDEKDFGTDFIHSSCPCVKLLPSPLTTRMGRKWCFTLSISLRDTSERFKIRMLTCARGVMGWALGLHQGPYAGWRFWEGKIGEGDLAAARRRWLMSSQSRAGFYHNKFVFQILQREIDRNRTYELKLWVSQLWTDLSLLRFSTRKDAGWAGFGWMKGWQSLNHLQLGHHKGSWCPLLHGFMN